MEKLKTIKENNCSLIEAGQGVRKVKFAYINPETGDAITPFCMCKDYFNDMWWSYYQKKPVSVYGFNWDKDMHRDVLSEDRLNVAIKITSGGNMWTSQGYAKNPIEDEILDDKRVKSLSKLINTFDKKLKLDKTKISLTEDKKYIIVNYDRRWSEIPYLNGAFFLFLRIGMSYESDKNVLDYITKTRDGFLSPYDTGYVSSSKNKIEDLYEGKIDKRQKYSDYNTGTIHNGSGPVGYKEYKIS